MYEQSKGVLGGIISRNVYRNPTQKIEIDCAPGKPLPSVYITDVIAGTGLPMRSADLQCMGRWTWDYSDISSALWNSALPVIEERLKALLESGAARYVWC